MTATSTFNRILAIDDQIEIREHYEALFSPPQNDLSQQIDNLFDTQEATPPPTTEYYLSTAHQGHIAIDMVQQSLRNNQPFKVAFIDVRMPPGMDGLVTAEKIRVLDPRIFIVFVTAYSDYDSDALSQRLGHSILLLHKPFAKHALLQLARNCCRNWDKQSLYSAQSSHNTAAGMAADVDHSWLTSAHIGAAIDDTLEPLQQHFNNIKTAELAATGAANHREARTSLLLEQVLKNYRQQCVANHPHDASEVLQQMSLLLHKVKPVPHDA